MVRFLGTDLWRETHQGPSGPISSTEGVFAHGRLDWLAGHCDDWPTRNASKVV